MANYHFNRPEKMIDDPAELDEIIAGGRLMTLALVKDGEPYLVTLDYGFDPERRCFYFHGAPGGKKLAYMAANPRVWGQVLEDRGYVTGKCDHAYRSVHFSGEVTLLEDEDEKRAAVALMICQLEPDPEPLLERLQTNARISTMTVGRVQVLTMTGKRNALELLPGTAEPGQ